MWCVYVLRSTKNGKYYKGFCENFEQRLASHNEGRVKSTSSGRPWVKHYTECFDNKAEAIRRERYFKTRSGYRWLKNNHII